MQSTAKKTAIELNDIRLAALEKLVSKFAVDDTTDPEMVRNRKTGQLAKFVDVVFIEANLELHVHYVDEESQMLFSRPVDEFIARFESILRSAPPSGPQLVARPVTDEERVEIDRALKDQRSKAVDAASAARALLRQKLEKRLPLVEAEHLMQFVDAYAGAEFERGKLESDSPAGQ